MLTIPNYQVLEQIYESANSLVYRGLRIKDNQPVILKILKDDYPTPEELTRYRQEFEMIHELDIDGVVKVYALEKYQNKLVMVLEDFGGLSLKHLLATESVVGKGLGSVSKFLPLAIQIANSLGHIHAHNIIHKDINPTNIVFNTTANQIKIIDFGISSRLPREMLTFKNPTQLEGTLAYISPEQTGRMNRSVDYRTDLYSLGVTFYELLTGNVPFEATEALELVHCHIAKNPVPLCEINADVPPILSQIVMKLLAKNVEKRYQSGFGLKWDLEKCLGNLQGFENLGGLDFKLAQHDFSGRFQIPQKLYGRETEIETLLQAFERVSLGTTEMMLVAGYSGVGKSALVHEIHKPITEKRGYFAAGKFDQYHRNIPYSAISAALDEFCHYLLTESSEQLDAWRETILTAIGNNGQVLIDIIPDLELIIGKQLPVTQVGPTEAQNRFNRVFQQFIHAISQPNHPLVLFIDDWQWADSASLNLLSTLMTDKANQYFLIIGAYRDNEVDAAHPFMITVEELKQAQVTLNTIFVPNLSQEDVNALISETLSCEPAHANALTKLVYEKTHGNAFFTLEFLKSLFQEALLVFDVKALKWQWDETQIVAKSLTDNVVELMADKISHLPVETLEALKLAACIGNAFDLNTLAIIYQQEPQATLQHLWRAIEEGLVFPLDDNYKLVGIIEKEVDCRFRFQHDRVQQAAYSLIADTDKQTIHLQIGRLLLANTPTTELEGNLFDIVNHLNEGRELIEDRAEKQKLAELNLSAGKKAKASAAYQPAFKFLKMGMELLEKESWQTQYDLTLALYEEAAETTYLCTDFEKSEQLAKVVLQHAKTVLDKVKVYESQSQVCIAQNQLLKTVEIQLEVLNLLGVHLPEKPTELDIQHGVEETLFLLGDKPIKDLIELSEMIDPDKLAAMRILSKTWLPAGFSIPELLPLVTLEMINLSVKYGNAPTSAYGYATGGFVFCGIMGDMEIGFEFGELALKILEQFNAIEIKAKVFEVVNLAVRPWKEHLKETLRSFIEAYQSGLETGDLGEAANSVADYLLYSYFLGQDLTVLQKETVIYSKATEQIKQKTLAISCNLVRQVVSNLTEHCENPCKLTGEAYHEITMLPHLEQANDRIGIFLFYLNKLILSYLFHENLAAFEHAKKAETDAEAIAGTFMMPVFCFYDSLAQLAIFPESSETNEQKNILDKVTGYQEQMEKWAQHAPMNFQHKYALVEAEKARVLGQDLMAMDWYEKAIAGARKNEYLQEEALAYERAAEFYLARGMEKIAQTYLREAHHAYQRWGALTKIKDLEKNYPQWCAKTANTALTDTGMTLTSTVTRRTSSSATITSASTMLATDSPLDLTTVMKASQAISSEIMLEALIKKFMQIVIENVGAEQGCLILKGERDSVQGEREAEKLFLEAYATLDNVEMLDSIPITSLAHHENQAQYLSETIVTYTARTQTPQVLNDASHEGLFTNDSYIVQKRPQSVLCFPMIYKNQLIGLFYLENNKTTGAFTAARLAVLTMLSTQIAISLENAQYANHLEEKVKQRTRQLAEANEKITALNERLKEENIRMSAELDVAKQLQQMVLPTDSELTQIPNLDIAGFMEPADEVGGDYYDVLVHEGRVKIGIGDVTGHGLESGVLMLMVQTAMRSLLDSGLTDPTHFLTTLNHTIYNNAQRMKTDKNLTLALLDYQEGRLRVTGQHEEVLLVRKESSQIERIDTFDLGFSVGVLDDITDFVSQKEIQLQPGDGIVLYTDGITEARNINRELYGLERLCEIVSCNWHYSASEIQQTVIADVQQYIGEQKVFDDITLLVLKQK